MTTLVTGASGFVGSAVTRALLVAGHSVRVLLRPTSDRRNLDGLSIDIATGDLTNTASLRAALNGCEALFHVAADYRLWVPRPDSLYVTNVAGTESLMRVAADAGVPRIVYTSSVATLGLNANGSPADEFTPVAFEDMVGHYKKSKFLAEEKVRQMVRENGLPAVIVNPSTPVGPRDRKPTPTGRMVLDAACGRMPAYVDTGLNLAHVDDVAAGHLAAFERGQIGERYILGGRNISLREIFVLISQLTNRPPPRVKLPHAVVLPLAYIAEAWARLTNGSEPRLTVDGVKLARKHMYFSCARAERELGYRARPVDAALKDAIDWFRQNGYLR